MKDDKVYLLDEDVVSLWFLGPQLVSILVLILVLSHRYYKFWSTPFHLEPTTKPLSKGVSFLDYNAWVELNPILGKPYMNPMFNTILVLFSVGIEAMILIVNVILSKQFTCPIYATYIGLTLISNAVSILGLAIEHQLFHSIKSAWPCHYSNVFQALYHLISITKIISPYSFDGSKPIWVKVIIVILLVRTLNLIFLSHWSLAHLVLHRFPLFQYPIEVQFQHNEVSNISLNSDDDSASDTDSDVDSDFDSDSDSRPVLGLLKRSISYIWKISDSKSRWLMLLFFILKSLIASIDSLVPFQYKIMMDSLPSVDKGILDAKINLDFKLFIIYGLLKIFQERGGFIEVIESVLFRPLTRSMNNKISLEIFSHLQYLSLDFHIQTKTHRIVRKMDRGVDAMVNLIENQVVDSLSTIVNLVTSLGIVAWKFDLTIFIVILTTMIFYTWASHIIGKWSDRLHRAIEDSEEDIVGDSTESLMNFETVKYFNNEKYEIQRYEKQLNNSHQSNWKLGASYSILSLAQTSILVVGEIIGSLVCSYQIANGTKVVGDFVLFNLYLSQLSYSLNSMKYSYERFLSKVICTAKFLDLLELEPTVKDLPTSTHLQVSLGKVEFSHVNFYYNSDKQAINDISFVILPGQTCALVGPSGGGKSTILKVFLRLYDIDSGVIKIDDQDIKSVTQDSLRQSIGIVPQDAVLFNDSIMYNIRYGKPSATDEEVEAAARKAQIHNMIQKLPDKYNTLVGERGIRLSGGERQRISIARALLRNPSIILLDEATSALDTNTERHIQQAFRSMSQGKTTLIIAHRLSTIVHADLILCIDEGRVIESGTHKELLQKNGVYSDLWNKQIHA